MSATLSNCPASPLYDCTNCIEPAGGAVSLGKSLAALKALNASSSAVVRRVRTPSAKTPDALVASALSAPLTATNGSSVNSSVDSHDCRLRSVAAAQQDCSFDYTSYTSTPMRHNPYSPVLVERSVSAYTSFVECYAVEPAYEAPAATATPTRTADESCAVATTLSCLPAPRSAALALAGGAGGSRQPASSRGAARAESAQPTSPVRSVEREGSVTTPSRVVVMRCGVDRTSGRPVPVRR